MNYESRITSHRLRITNLDLRTALATAIFISLVAVAFSAEPPVAVVVDAIRMVESGGRNVSGDGGRAVGEWQLHAGACEDAGKREAASGKRQAGSGKLWSEQDRWVPERAREIATAYVTLLSGELAKRLRRAPTTAEIYAAYNLGLRGFERRGFALRRCPKITRERAAIVAASAERRAREIEDKKWAERYQELVKQGRSLARNAETATTECTK
jgi:hypothetical protein